jgi:acid phosphatase (class A)
MKRRILFVAAGLVLSAAAGGRPNESCPPARCASEAASDAPRLKVPSEHYARLARLDMKPRRDAGVLDRKQFDLGAMNPGYFKILGRAPVYLAEPPVEFLLPEFPANSSAQTRAELDYLLELQAKARTPEAVARSQTLAGVFYRVSTQPGDEDYARMRQNLFFTGRELGGWFGPETLPRTADLLARVQSDATYYIWAFKYRFNRVRPWELEPKLERLETPNFPAYPSAHSGNSWTAAFVFSELLPEDRDVFARGAAELAYSREILGVHFPSDSESGKALARQVVDRMLASPGFREDVAAARAEIAAAKRTQKSTPAAASTAGRKDDCF